MKAGRIFNFQTWFSTCGIANAALSPLALVSVLLFNTPKAHRHRLRSGLYERIFFIPLLSVAVNMRIALNLTTVRDIRSRYAYFPYSLRQGSRCSVSEYLIEKNDFALICSEIISSCSKSRKIR